MRTLSLIVAGLALSFSLTLTPVAALSSAQAKPAPKHATAAHKSKHVTAKHRTRHVTRHITIRKRGLGYLPGFGPKGVYADAPRERLYGQPYSATGYSLPPFYTWDGDRYYAGRPRFSGGRWNGGSFGPCYTQTPIGPMWNCGK
jgi:hypothetical protein